MRTIKIEDETHSKLTVVLGKLVAQTGKMKTYNDALEALLNNSIMLPPELSQKVEDFIEKNKHKGYKSKDEFIIKAINLLLKKETEEQEQTKLPKNKLK
jgi:hypothetical protein